MSRESDFHRAAEARDIVLQQYQQLIQEMFERESYAWQMFKAALEEDSEPAVVYPKYMRVPEGL